MSTEQAVASTLAAAEKRCDEVAALSDILSVQVKRQRRELQAIRAAIVLLVPGKEGRGQVSRGDISPEDLLMR